MGGITRIPQGSGVLPFGSEELRFFLSLLQLKYRVAMRGSSRQ